MAEEEGRKVQFTEVTEGRKGKRKKKEKKNRAQRSGKAVTANGKHYFFYTLFKYSSR